MGKAGGDGKEWGRQEVMGRNGEAGGDGKEWGRQEVTGRNGEGRR